MTEQDDQRLVLKAAAAVTAFWFLVAVYVWCTAVSWKLTLAISLAVILIVGSIGLAWRLSIAIYDYVKYM